MLVVADTSPINYLIQIGHVEVLPAIYGHIVLPAEVRVELIAPDAPAVVRAWAVTPPVWAEVLQGGPARWPGLGPGESAAISLAIKESPSVLLIDERAGTKVARSLGVAVTGTLGVLDEAARRRLLSFPDAITRLRSTSFRYPIDVIERLLREHEGRS